MPHTAYACLALVVLACPSIVQANDRPNIIVVMLDDMGFSDLGCYGSEISTPTIDRLAREGMRFSQFYTSSKCEAARATLLSGHYHTTVGRGSKRGIERGSTMGEVMKTAGYRTIASGKWHVAGTPENRGFDRAFGHLSGATQYFVGDNTYYLDGKPFEVPDSGFYLTDETTDFAIEMIEEERQTHPGSPFFMYLAYAAPHAPLQAPRELIEKYRGRFKEGWDVLRQKRYERQVAMGLIRSEWRLPDRPEQIPAWDSLDEKSQHLEDLRMAIYAAMIDRVDQNLGRLRRKLEEWGIANNTLILLMSDNGASPYDRSRIGELGSDRFSRWHTGVGWAWLSNTPFRYYKRAQHAGGITSPLIVWWPGKIQPTERWIDQPYHLIDIMPTLMEITGASYPAAKTDPSLSPLPGKSLLPTFLGKPGPEHDALYFALIRKQAVIENGWKLVRGYGQPWQLYNLTADRTETRNLIDQYPNRAASLKTSFEGFVRQNEIDVSNWTETPPEYIPLYKPDGTLNAPLKRSQASSWRMHLMYLALATSAAILVLYWLRHRLVSFGDGTSEGMREAQ